MAATIIVVAKYFARLGMAPSVLQATIGGPSLGWLISQSWRRVEDLAKQYAASKRKGTVGRKGKGTPSRANVKKRKPRQSQTRRILGDHKLSQQGIEQRPPLSCCG